MRVLSAIKSIVTGLLRSLKRFPITILFSTLVGVILIVMEEIQPVHDSSFMDMINRITMIFALGVPLSLCIKLLLERKQNRSLLKLIKYYGMGALILILYYLFLLDGFNMVSITRFTAVNLALYLAFLYIPYLPKRERFEMYIIKVFTNFFTTIIYSIVLFLGLAVILFTIDKLLGIHIEGKVYYYTWLFVVCVFAPSYFLAGVPVKDEEFTKENYPKLLKILLLYIVMPLLTAYTSILYIYFIKIIATRQWPVGLVSHLVLWYSAIVAVVLFFITPLKGDNNWAGKFLKWSPRIIIPVLVMMFISMGIRVKAYGITENRYFVVVLAFWVLGVMVYLFLTKNAKNIFIPAALSLIALISVFGPISSYSISRMSQNNRLEKILVRNDMLKDGMIQASPSTISMEDKEEISRILDYFSLNHTLGDVKYLPEGFKSEDMDKVFGFPYEEPKYHSPQEYFYFIRDNSESGIDVSGYDYLFDTRDLYIRDEVPQGEINTVYDYESATIRVEREGSIIYEKDLKPFAKSLAEKYKGVVKENTIPAEEMMFVDENEKVKIKFIFMDIAGENFTGNIRVNGMEFYMLLKVK